MRNLRVQANVKNPRLFWFDTMGHLVVNLDYVWKIGLAKESLWHKYINAQSGNLFDRESE